MVGNSETINSAFSSDVNLRKRILDAINDTPQHAPLFEDIAKFHLASSQSAAPEQPSKKRKLDDGIATPTGLAADQPRNVLLEARDISFTLPQRKKLHLSIVQYGEFFEDPATKHTLCARNPATNQVEFEIPISEIAYALRVPVPEKAQKQYNFCFLPPQFQLASTSPTALNDGIIWTMNSGPLKSLTIPSEAMKANPGEEGVFEATLDSVLLRSAKKLISPTEAEFVSALVESHRKNDKAYHVKAFRGSKDGFLFFLENGIFFGFKKPLAFFPFENIASVSYTAVLQRTFNLVIVVQGNEEAEQQEIEFSMLDQADFGGIDGYIKKHQLQDTSMAEARRAKKFNVNGARACVNVGEATNEQSELEKAEQELEDEEDEMEEDYDPGSDDESGGSGSSDDDDYEYPKNSGGRDLIKDELGSEAEEVDVTDEEEEEEGEEEDEEIEEKQPPPQSKVKQSSAQSIPVHKKPVVLPAVLQRYTAPEIDDEDQL